MTEKYILDGDTPVECDNLLKWGQWMENHNNRRVDLWEKNGVKVSTVFLGLDHNWNDDGPPVLWETMVFGGDFDQHQQRYTSAKDARDGHQEVVRMVEGGVTNNG